MVDGVRCPWCAVDDDRVVDSRLAEEGGAIRRRRECLGCGRRFTTFERVEEVPLWVVKRTGLREPFDRAKVVAGVRSACKNRPVSDSDMEELAQAVEDALRSETAEPTSQQVGWPCWSGCRRLTTWRTSVSPASTRVLRMPATSNGKSAS